MLQHNVVVYQFCRPVWDRWLELAILSGELDVGEKGAKEVKGIAQGFDWMRQLFSYLQLARHAFNVSSISSVIILSKLLIKMVDQKSCFMISTLLPVKFEFGKKCFYSPT